MSKLTNCNGCDYVFVFSPFIYFVFIFIAVILAMCLRFGFGSITSLFSVDCTRHLHISIQPALQQLTHFFVMIFICLRIFATYPLIETAVRFVNCECPKSVSFTYFHNVWTFMISEFTHYSLLKFIHKFNWNVQWRIYLIVIWKCTISSQRWPPLHTHQQRTYTTFPKYGFKISSRNQWKILYESAMIFSGFETGNMTVICHVFGWGKLRQWQNDNKMITFAFVPNECINYRRKLK